MVIFRTLFVSDYQMLRFSDARTYNNDRTRWLPNYGIMAAIVFLPFEIPTNMSGPTIFCPVFKWSKQDGCQKNIWLA
jgi:hypothetical protein